MITCQCAVVMPTYAANSSYLTPIPDVNIDRGVIPLDSLPADWWNWLWNNITLNEGYIVAFINSVFSEINSVLSAAGVNPSSTSTTDLRDAIQNLASVVATSSVPGSVLSSTLSGKLNVIADGTASINGLGTPSSLQTVATDVVSAINEVLALAQGKAPTSHASSNNTYGVGTTQQFGHVKVTEGCGLAICDGTISLNAPGYNCLGNVTTICFNGNTYTPTDGVIDLGSQTVSVDCMCQRAITSSVSGDFYSLLGGGLCRNTTGVDTVNLTGLAWDPVRCSLDWCNTCSNISIGGNTCTSVDHSIALGVGAELTGSCGIAIGYIARTAVSSVAIGMSACTCCGESVAIGPSTHTYYGNSVAIGNNTQATCASVALGFQANAHNGYSISIGWNSRADDTHSIAIGTKACAVRREALEPDAAQNSVAIGYGAWAGSICCCDREFIFSTIGNTYQFIVRTDTASSSSLPTMTWGNLAGVLYTLFRCCYQGPWSRCAYLYLSRGEGTTYCSDHCNCSSYPKTSTQDFRFFGSIGLCDDQHPLAPMDKQFLYLYWGGCIRCINEYCTGKACWVDTIRTIAVTGIITGSNGRP